MALTNCPECQRQVSSSAAACPQCGYLMAGKQPTPSAQQSPPAQPFRLPASDEEWEEVKGALVGAAIIIALPAAGAWYFTKVVEASVAGGVVGLVGCMLIKPLRRRLLQGAAAFLILVLALGALLLILYFIGH